MPRDVRTHTRRTASGKTTTVRHHTRDGNAARPQKLKGKRGPNPGHAGKLGRRSVAAMKRNRKGKAALLLTLAGAELAAWLTLGGTSLLLALLAGVLAFISVILVR